MKTVTSQRFEYAGGYIYGQGDSDRDEKSLAGLRLGYCLAALSTVRGKVLEIGCGGGKIIRALRSCRPELQLFGCDIQEAAIRTCRTQPQGAGYFVADAGYLAHPAQSLDAVVICDVLEHLADPSLTIREVWRVLKPHGIFHLYVPCEGEPTVLYRWCGHRLKRKYGGHLQQFSRQQVIRLCRQQGFCLQRIRYSDYWCAQIFDMGFFLALSLLPDKSLLWQAHGATGQRSCHSRFSFLRIVRQLMSAVSFYESIVPRGSVGAMGMHITCRKP